MLFELGGNIDEFVAVLQERNGVIAISTLCPAPAGEKSASFFIDMLPAGYPPGRQRPRPNGLLSPSPADLRFFPSVVLPHHHRPLRGRLAL